MANTFTRWLDTYFDEKGVDTDQPINVMGSFGMNYMTVGTVFETIKSTSGNGQSGIKKMLVRTDFANACPVDYLCHLAKAIVV